MADKMAADIDEATLRLDLAIIAYAAMKAPAAVTSKGIVDARDALMALVRDGERTNVISEIRRGASEVAAAYQTMPVCFCVEQAISVALQNKDTNTTTVDSVPSVGGGAK